MSDQTFECIRCGHAYPPEYMAEIETDDDGIEWACRPSVCRALTDGTDRLTADTHD